MARHTGMTPRFLPAVSAVALSAMLVTACGTQQYNAGSTAADTPTTKVSTASPTAPPADVVPDDYTGPLRGSFTVLESPEHGPQLCSGVDESLPPQCAGPDIVDWTWQGLESESVQGTTWGEFEVTGTYVDGVFTLTEPAGPARYPGGGDEPAPTPCPEPSEGWKPVDSARATQEAQNEALRIARESGELGGVWISWLVPTSELTEQNANDPSLYVLNISTTGDIAATEQKVRTVWGGSLCVSAARRTEHELNQIATEAMQWPGVTSTSADIVEGDVDVGAWVVTESLWRRAVDEFGPGVIDLHGHLQPVKAG